MIGISIAAFRPSVRRTLRGFADVGFNHLIICDVAVHQIGPRAWINLPSRPMLKDGSPVLTARGKPAYLPLLRFDEEVAALQFERAVIAALRAAYPSALAAVAS